MRVPLSWLQEFVPFTQSAQEIADMLTSSGLEVEAIHEQTPPFSGVVVGRVESTTPHPEADRLSVAQVSDGIDTYQVVCAAPNCRAGITVAFAKVGARLDITSEKPIKIKKGKLRGVPSLGMLCAADELGLGNKSEGILELPDSYSLGTDFASLHGDTVLDIALTPNLSHCASILGVARELGALLNHQVKVSPVCVHEAEGTDITEYISVKVDDHTLCPRYACRVITGVKVGPSPDWLRQKVEATGCRSVNNIVDITNFVLMELGHPLHAFDLSCVKGGIQVRCAQEGEPLTTLDGNARKLSEGTLVISDEAKALGLAGVMGGENSEVSEETTAVLLEAAIFKRTCIHRTAKTLALHSEASRRFERGVDAQMVIHALDRAAALIADLSGGQVVKGLIDCKEKEPQERVVTCRHAQVNALLGTQLAIGEIETIFKNLDLCSRLDQNHCFHVTIPTYRHDIKEEVDLIEEVARIYGYDKIPRGRARYSYSTLPHSPIYRFEQDVRHRLLREGLQEFITCDLISPKLVRTVTPKAEEDNLVIKVLNPTSMDQSLLRTSLLPGFLQLVKHNLDHGTRSIHGYEVGRIHFNSEEGFKEQSMAGILLSGPFSEQSWTSTDQLPDFFDLKGIVENTLASLGVKDARFERSQQQSLHPGRQASIHINDLQVGELGQVHPDLLHALDIDQEVLFAEINLHALFTLRRPKQKMQPLPQFPGSDRDWTLTLHKDVAAQDVFDAIKTATSPLLTETRLVAVYESEQLGADRKNLSFRFVYRSHKKTLSQEAVEREHARVVQHITQQLGDRLLA